MRTRPHYEGGGGGMRTIERFVLSKRTGLKSLYLHIDEVSFFGRVEEEKIV